MKVYQVVLLCLALLFLNNIVLYFLFGVPFSENKLSATIATTQVNDTVSKPSAAPINLLDDSIETSTSAQKRQVSEDNPTETISAQEAVIYEALQRFSENDTFAALIDEHEFNRSKQGIERNNYIQQLDATDLARLVVDSSNAQEKQNALILLLSNETLYDLDVSEIKNLYYNAELEEADKANLLKALIDYNDVDSVATAKQMLESNQITANFSLALISSIHDFDSQFAEDYVARIKLDDLVDGFGLGSLASDKLLDIFYENNFDAVLKSTNQNVLFEASRSIKFELDDQQESALTDLLAASNPDQRNFALNLVDKIKDTDRLKRAYATIKRDNDRKIFLQRLLSQTKNSELYNLGIELVNKSGYEKL